MRTYLENPRQVRDASIGTPVLRPVGGHAPLRDLRALQSAQSARTSTRATRKSWSSFIAGKVNQFVRLRSADLSRVLPTSAIRRSSRWCPRACRMSVPGFAVLTDQPLRHDGSTPCPAAENPASSPPNSFNRRGMHGFARIGRTAMIQVKRFSHATFETPDVERQIDYFSQVVGLAVAGKQNGHVHLATKVGDLAVQVNKGSQPACTKLVVPGRSATPLRRHPQGPRRRGHQERGAQRRRARHPQSDRVQGSQGHRDRDLCRAEADRRQPAGRGHRPAQARPSRVLRRRLPRPTPTSTAR